MSSGTGPAGARFSGMLDQHPNTKRVLAGIGGFAFVFTAAMAGTGMMMTGGIINDRYLGGDVERIAPTQAVDPITVMMADWEPSQDGYAYAPTLYSSARYGTVQPVGYTFDDAMAAHQAAAMRAEARGDVEAMARHTRSQAAIERDIERLYQETYLNPQQAEPARPVTTAEPEATPEPTTEPEAMFETPSAPDELPALEEPVPTKKG